MRSTRDIADESPAKNVQARIELPKLRAEQEALAVWLESDIELAADDQRLHLPRRIRSGAGGRRWEMPSIIADRKRSPIGWRVLPMFANPRGLRKTSID